VLNGLQRQGFYLASVDSAGVTDEAVTLYASRGPEVRVAEVAFHGVQSLDAAVLRDGLDTRPGRVLDRDRLEQDVQFVLAEYERNGFPLARVRVSDLDLANHGDGYGLRVVLDVEEGRQLTFSRLDLGPKARTSPLHASRVTNLRPGEILVPYDPEAIQRQLDASGLFAEVGTPYLEVTLDYEAVIHVPVTEAAPGNFDLMLGYLPARTPDESGSVIGNGLIVLRNVFGRGLLVSARLTRNPGLVNSIEARVADPYLLGMPLGVEAGFEGYQRDSTFTRQRYNGQAAYRFGSGIEVLAVASREQTQPGPHGFKLVNGRTRVPGSDAWFAGAGLRFRRVDRVANPRRGLFIESILEQGTKSRSLNPLDTLSIEPLRVNQQRLLFQGRLYVPTLPRQVLVTGGEGSVLLGQVYDESDLFRFGGANTLRGYDEDRFRGNVVARGLAEYRYQIDRTSYAFLFADLGYVARPDTPAAPGSASQGFYPGYGLGIQYSTPVGLITVSYALNPEDGFTSGKIHAGLSFGL
jgi:outer membrane protein assembly factor BamA